MVMKTISQRNQLIGLREERSAPTSADVRGVSNVGERYSTGLLVIDSRKCIRFLDENGRKLLHLIGHDPSSHFIPDIMLAPCQIMIEHFRLLPGDIDIYQFYPIQIDLLRLRGIGCPKHEPTSSFSLFLILDAHLTE